MKGRILLLVYGILTVLFMYGRIDGNENLALVKSFVLTPLIAYYLVTIKKIDYKFVLVLLLFLLGDALFALTEYQYVGFVAYFMANTSLSLLILHKMDMLTSNNFSKVLGSTAFITVILLYLFNDNPFFQKALLWAFHIAIGVVALVSYLRHNKITKIFSLWMLLASLLFVFCNFLANMNYFFVNNIFFRILISISYILFLFGITYSMVLEEKEKLTEA